MAVPTQALGTPRALPAERTVLAAEERRPAVLEAIAGARKRILLSLFRCSDAQILQALSEALARGVKVRVLLTSRARGWKQRLKVLWDSLESMGAQVHRYPDSVVKYHAKYLVIDEGPAVVASLNFTRKCFSRTCDFLHFTYDPDVVAGLERLFESDCRASESPLPEGICERIIVGPERARGQIAVLVGEARRRIRIIDTKLTDPEMVALIQARRAEGIDVEILGNRRFQGMRSHGKLMLVDDAAAVIGSLSLATLSLEFRRELALVVRDRRSVRALSDFFEAAAAPRRTPGE